MIKDAVLAVLNDHFNHELYSAYIYYAMSAWLERQGLNGCGKWMHVQGQEELFHAQKFYRYILDRDGDVSFQPIAQPPQQWSDVRAVFEDSHAHECAVSERINKLMDIALANSDHATTNFLRWFVTEQVEEEATVRDLIDKLGFIGDNGSALLIFDQELGNRSLQVPATMDVPGN